MEALKDRRRTFPSLSWTLYDISFFIQVISKGAHISLLGYGSTSRKDNSIQIWLRHFSSRELQCKRSCLLLFWNKKCADVCGSSRSLKGSRKGWDSSNPIPIQPFQFHFRNSLMLHWFNAILRKTWKVSWNFPVR